MVKACSMHEMRNACTILGVMPKGKRQLGRYICSYRRYNIKMYLKKIVWKIVDWINPLKPNGNYMYHLL
jgi:hypothetical protein